MNYRRLFTMFVAVVALAAALSVPGLPGGALNLGGPAAAQEAIDVDYFYDQLDPYGQWVWHPRYGYVWLPGNVRESWRPYTVGHWVYTDEYGWYWDSYEPFAWAVYHYGRWGYDPDYGWFWVPGDTWAPAWVNWRYSDNYTGWAPIGPGPSGGYAYGAPVYYDPPVAESWVFVQPRYMTSRTIYHYALPVADLNIAFIGATNVYRPVYRTGVVFNFGVPRERVVKVVNRPIVVKKIVKVTNVTNKTVIYKNGKQQGNGIKVFAPNMAKGAKPRKDPKRFASSPKEFKAHAKLKTTIKGDAPKGVGQSAAKVTPIAREVGADGFNPKKQGGGEARKHDNKQNEAKGNAQGGGGQGGGGGGGQGGGDNKAANKNDKGRNEAKAKDKNDGAGKADLTPGGGGGNTQKFGTSGVPSAKTKAPIGSPPTGADNADQGEAANGDGGGGQGQGGKKNKNKDGDNRVGSREPGGGQGGGGEGGGGGGQGGKLKKGPGGGPGGPGQGQAGGQGKKGQGGQQAEGGGQGNKAEKCKKNPDLPACQKQ